MLNVYRRPINAVLNTNTRSKLKQVKIHTEWLWKWGYQTKQLFPVLIFGIF